MNLATDKWIPVLDGAKRKRLVSLHEAFAEGDTIPDLAVNPVQRIALMRLLICITQAALDGPADEEDWYHCAPRIPKAAKSYLETWRQAFELYGDNAFLQAPTSLTPLNPSDCFDTPVDKLDIVYAAGSTGHTLFDREAASKDRKRAHSPSRIALELLQFQSFALGGGQSKKARLAGRLVDGSVNSRKNNNYTAGPCAGSKLFTFVKRGSLIESLHANLVTRQQLNAEMPNVEFGRPVWEEPSIHYDSRTRQRLSKSYLVRLVPMSRFLRLSPQSLTHLEFVTNGFEFADDPLARRDPFLTVLPPRGDDPGETPTYLRAKPGRHPWRDLHAIASIENHLSCLSLAHLSLMAHADPNGVAEIWVGALISNQGNPIEATEWTLALPLQFLETTARLRYADGVLNYGEAKERSLRRAVSSYFGDLHVPQFRTAASGRFELNDPRSRDFREQTWERARLGFWGELDSQYSVLVDCALKRGTEIEDRWGPVAHRAAAHAYAATCPHTTPRQIQAFAKGRQELAKWRRKKHAQAD